jgi:DNA-directed RNA polymerase specialized sigma24 family protein
LFAAAGDAGESRKQKAENRDLGVAVPGVAARAVVKAVEAAMERFEGKLAGVRKDFADWQKSPRPANKAGQAEPPEPSPPNETNLSLAAKVFELLTALDPDNRLRKAPPIKVFLLHFRQNLSRSQVARVCGCSRTLVAERLRSIRDKLPWQPHQLRELSAHVEAM